MDICCGCAEITAGPGSSEENPGGFFWRLGTCLVLAGITMLLEIGLADSSRLGAPLLPGDPAYWWVHGGMIAAALLALLLLGTPLLRSVTATVLRGKFSLESLFLLSATGAFIASFAASLEGTGRDVYYTTVAVVMIIYASGKQLRHYSRERARQSAQRLRDRFSFAWIQTAGGAPQKKPVARLTPEDRVVVAPGDAITVDGRILEGKGFLQETTLTGEPLPVARGPGDLVLAGTMSLDGHLLIQPVHAGQPRQIDAILSAVEQAAQTPSRFQAQADQLMRYFLPSVLGFTLLTLGGWWYFTDFSSALFHAMAVLLVACPCALGLATPVALWSGLYRLSQLGLVSRSADLLDHLAHANRFVFDKTGTLSHGEIVLAAWHFFPEWETRSEFLRALVAAVQARQNHPVARAFQRDLAAIIPAPHIALSLRTIPGLGIEAHLRQSDSTDILLQIGAPALFSPPLQQAFSSSFPSASTAESSRRVCLAIDHQPAAWIALEEKLRPDAESALCQLRALGIHSTILTGDAHPRWTTIAGVEVLSGLTPLAKENHIRQWQNAGEHIIVVGDGINDSAAMARASAGIAMGSGTDLTRATAHGVLVGDSLATLPPAVRLARRIHRTLRSNLRYAVAYNLAGMTLAAAGWLSPVSAAIIMLLSSAWVSWRALRAAEIT